MIALHATETAGNLDWLGPILAFIGVLMVAGITAASVKGSDERKIRQEDKRRWDTDLVNTAVEMLVITDDIASSKKDENEKVKAIRVAEFPADLQTHMTKIRLLSNERIGDLCQETVRQYMIYRFAIKNRLEALEAEDKDQAKQMLQNGDLGYGLLLNSTHSDDYWEARTQFNNAVHELVVADEVRAAGAPKVTDFRELMRIAEVQGSISGDGYTRTERRTDSQEPNTVTTESVPEDVPSEVPADNSEKNSDLENKP